MVFERYVPTLTVLAILSGCSDDGGQTSSTDEQTSQTDTSGSTSEESGNEASSSGPETGDDGTSAGDGTSTSTTETTSGPAETTTSESGTDSGTASSTTTGDTETATDSTSSSAEDSSGSTSSGTSTGETDDGGEGAGIVEDCSLVESESRVCFTVAGVDSPLLMSDNVLLMIGLDTGTACPVRELDVPSGEVLWGPSLVVQESHALVCDGTMVRIALEDGTLEDSSLPCVNVASDDGPLVVQPTIVDTMLSTYASWEAFLDETPSGTLTPDMPSMFARLQVHGDELFLAWQEATALEVFSMPSGDFVRSVTLAGYDDWIRGLDVLDDGSLVIADLEQNRLAIFDASGEALMDVHPSPDIYVLNGLDCR